MKNVGVLISGRGTNLQALIDAAAGARLGGGPAGGDPRPLPRPPRPAPGRVRPAARGSPARARGRLRLPGRLHAPAVPRLPPRLRGTDPERPPLAAPRLPRPRGPA